MTFIPKGAYPQEKGGYPKEEALEPKQSPKQPGLMYSQIQRYAKSNEKLQEKRNRLLGILIKLSGSKAESPVEERTLPDNPGICDALEYCNDTYDTLVDEINFLIEQIEDFI